MLDSGKNLFRKGFANPNSPLFIKVEQFRPTPKQVTDLIHKAGGKAFLAHPYQYAFTDIFEMINKLRKECDLDGIEVYHSSFTKQEMTNLEKYTKNNKLYMSGGSDYHGTRKPEKSLKTGCNNLFIEKKILSWL